MAGISGINIDVGSILGNLGSIGKLFKDIRTAITGKEILDPNKQAELELRIQEAEASLNMSQIEINKIEAAHASRFIAGWRPFVGWVCGFALAWQFVLGPVAVWLVALMGKDVSLPQIDTALMIQVLFAMLGLGVMRSYEKIKNAEGNR